MNLVLFLGLACVWDRTGQSATTVFKTKIGYNSKQISQAEGEIHRLQERIAQLEEVTRSRGRDEIMKMETMDEIRTEVANLRNDIEILSRDHQVKSETSESLASDTTYRLEWLEDRAKNVESMLGLEMTRAPSAEGEGAAEKEAQPKEDQKQESAEDQKQEPDAKPSPKDESAEVQGKRSPKQILELAKEHLDKNRELAAEAVLKNFLKNSPKHKLRTEALYRYAEAAFQREDYQTSAKRFQEVLDDNKKSKWASWALYKQGECFELLKEVESANIFYEDVLKEYPKSKAAQEAKKKLKK